MTSKLCPHVTWAHFDAPRDRRIFERWRPVAVKVMWPNGPHPYLDMFRDVPLIVMREWALSEEKDFDSTEAAKVRGHQHADRSKAMWDYVRQQYGLDNPAQFAWEGLNEPWQVPAPLVAAYDVARLDRLREYGLRGVALNYGVGWPANSGPDTPVDWRPLAPVYDAIRRGNHLLGLHEYWWHESVKGLHPDGRGGLMGGWRWEAGRYLQCPWDVPIVITETGIDEGVVPGQPNVGWRMFYEGEPQKYVAQLAEYDAELRKDRRIVAAFIYTHDTNDRKWQSFDTRHDGFLSAFLPYIESQRNTPDPAPGPEPAPQPQPGQLPDFIRDVVDALPKHPTKRYATRPLAGVKRIVIHHTASWRDTTTPEAIARYHVNTHGWAGSAYHVVIDGSGQAYLVNRLETAAAGATGFNETSVHLTFTGFFTAFGKEAPSAAQIETGHKALAWLYGQLGLGPEHVTGHKNLPGHSTECPGSGPQEDWWRVLVVTPAVPINQVVYHAEEAARQARAGQGQQAHDRLVAYVIPYLIARRDA